jgi:hypothetical protein
MLAYYCPQCKKRVDAALICERCGEETISIDVGHSSSSLLVHGEELLWKCLDCGEAHPFDIHRKTECPAWKKRLASSVKKKQTEDSP